MKKTRFIQEYSFDRFDELCDFVREHEGKCDVRYRGTLVFFNEDMDCMWLDDRHPYITFGTSGARGFRMDSGNNKLYDVKIENLGIDIADFRAELTIEQ